MSTARALFNQEFQFLVLLFPSSFIFLCCLSYQRQSCQRLTFFRLFFSSTSQECLSRAEEFSVCLSVALSSNDLRYHVGPIASEKCLFFVDLKGFFFRSNDDSINLSLLISCGSLDLGLMSTQTKVNRRKTLRVSRFFLLLKKCNNFPVAFFCILNSHRCSFYCFRFFY